jgi:soluble lytic murein transglycosylase-like protein
VSTLLTAAAVLSLAAQCQHSFPPAMILAIARNESMVAPDQFNPRAVNMNRDGSRDLGLMQVNSRNFAWLGLTEDAALNPCISIGAAEQVLRAFSSYNSGSPTKSADYALRAFLALRGAAAANPSATPKESSPSTASDQTGIFARKAKIGRELVINTTKDTQ